MIQTPVYVIVLFNGTEAEGYKWECSAEGVTYGVKRASYSLDAESKEQGGYTNDSPNQNYFCQTLYLCMHCKELTDSDLEMDVENLSNPVCNSSVVLNEDASIVYADKRTYHNLHGTCTIDE